MVLHESTPRIVAVVAALLTLACDTGATEANLDASASDAGEYSASPEIVKIRSYHDLDALFESLAYTSESWQAGNREVPRIYLSEIPRRWGESTVKGIDVLHKKRLFFRVLAPLALRSNELILQDRKRLDELAAEGSPSDLASLPANAQIWLRELANRYRLQNSVEGPFPALLAALQERVDIIPVSLVLSQAAEESGWGTSRFAFQGNSLFGQWTWGKGITPANQRTGKGNYKIAVFDTPLDSVRAHATNLNSHGAYSDFRAMRAKMRASGATLSGRSLAEGLTRYSERGADYVKSLQAIIRVNKLSDTDSTHLGDMRPKLLVPVEDPSGVLPD